MNEVPKSLKVALALITILVPMLTVIGNYAMYGYRVEQLEIRISNDEHASQKQQDDYHSWQQTISSDVATTRTNVEWIRQEMQQQRKP